MNHKLKTIAIFFITWITLSFSLITLAEPSSNVQCANSPDGKPQVIENLLKCDLRSSFDDKNLTQQTLGIVQRIDVSSDIRLDVSPQTVATILGENTITFPTQPLAIDLVMGNRKGEEQILPVTMQVNPVLTKTGGICDLNFVDFSPNVSNFTSPNLPKWISQGIEKVLNKNQQIRDKMLKFANDAAAKLRLNLAICEE